MVQSRSSRSLRPERGAVGGWGIDAPVGEQTRDHRDLDERTSPERRRNSSMLITRAPPR
ncbi:nucleotidyltransferase domain-containing protein [Streptomyces sp. Ag109_G2-15]|uniref:nucleotidyltransferase domain-containing protein n=1 Tax=Streptomyces sp. Ag109_G2-15 TaxID=1938850 RepID=UPI00359C6E9B